MNKNYAIYQIDAYSNKKSKKYELIKSYCCESVEKYAQKYDFDYFLINLQSKNFSFNDKIQTYKYILANNYEKTLFLDMDIYINDISTNIFNNEFKNIAGCLAMEEIRRYGINHIIEKIKNKNLIQIIENDNIRYNGGVLLFENKFMFNILNNFNELDILMLEDDEIFLMYKLAGINKTILPNIWNARGINYNNLLYFKTNNYFIHLIASRFDCEGIEIFRDKYHTPGVHLNMQKILEFLDSNEVT